MDKIFSRGKSSDASDAVFKKLSIFLNSDDAQNAAMPEETKSILSMGGAVDQLNDAIGEFGRDPSNPIPVNGPVGEVTYLSALTMADGRGIWAHRLGSRDRIDIFEVVSEDGKDWSLLYLTPYHPRKSRLVPKGFRFRESPRVRGIFATNQHVSDFPLSLHDAIREWSKATLGYPLVSPGLRAAIHSFSFQRPSHHIFEVNALTIQGKTNHSSITQSSIFREWTQSNLMNPLLSVLKNNIGYDEIDVDEVLMFCATMMSYCYLRFGPAKPDHEMLDEFHRKIVEDIATSSRSFDASLSLYQTRYQEYAVLMDPVLETKENQGDRLTTLMMHIYERATHATAHGKMIKIVISSSAIAVLLDETFKFAKRQAGLASM